LSEKYTYMKVGSISGWIIRILLEPWSRDLGLKLMEIKELDMLIIHMGMELKLRKTLCHGFQTIIVIGFHHNCWWSSYQKLSRIPVAN
jgi:hypothetical protein